MSGRRHVGLISLSRCVGIPSHLLADLACISWPQRLRLTHAIVRSLSRWQEPAGVEKSGLATLQPHYLASPYCFPPLSSSFSFSFLCLFFFSFSFPSLLSFSLFSFSFLSTISIYLLLLSPFVCASCCRALTGASLCDPSPQPPWRRKPCLASMTDPAGARPPLPLQWRPPEHLPRPKASPRWRRESWSQQARRSNATLTRSRQRTCALGISSCSSMQNKTALSSAPPQGTG